jgi:pSer/pThr/pTyr-binding forkhead associated (FHA) protein
MTSILILQHQRPDGEVDTYHLKAGRRYHLGRGSQCQVRVLDLKLSRQHCAFEHGDAGWQLVDLASTNGCSVDGERVSGSRSLRHGSLVAAGSTTVRVERITDSSEDPDAVPAEAQPPAENWPEQAESEPPRASDRLAAAAARSAHSSDELEPQAVPDRVTQSDPLIPGLPATATAAAAAAPAPPPAPPEPQPGLDHDVLATLQPGRYTPPAAAAATTPASEPVSRTFYINVLGRRVGPLSKAQARDLKTKELKGTLTPSDLASVEAEASLGPIPATVPGAAPNAASDEQRTYYVTLLGQRVGPLSRSQARELKAKELRGVLTAEEVERLVR